MSDKINKTNAVRLLDKAGIPYRLIPYPVDENNLDARHVADALGEDISCVFKTLVLEAVPAAHFVCVIPGDKEVDLKKAAKIAGAKKADLIPMKTLLPTTGYIRGGCSPIAMKKSFPTFIHESALACHEIFVSAGVRGLQIAINPADLINFIGASTADIIKS